MESLIQPVSLLRLDESQSLLGIPSTGYLYGRLAGSQPPAAKDGDDVKPVAGRSTDAASVGDGRGPSSVADPYRRRRAGLWGAAVGPERLDLGGTVGTPFA